MNLFSEVTRMSKVIKMRVLHDNLAYTMPLLLLVRREYQPLESVPPCGMLHYVDSKKSRIYVLFSPTPKANLEEI